MKGKKKQQRIREKYDQIDRYIFMLLIAIIAILPLLTRTKAIDYVSPIITRTSYDTGLRGDVFSYYKFVFLVIMTAVIASLFLYKMKFRNYQVRASYLNGVLASLFIIVLLSGFFSHYKMVAMMGVYNRYEGTITYLCYLTLLFIAANIEYPKEKLRYFIYALYPITIANTILGVLDFYGFHIIKHSFIKFLLFPSYVTEEMIEARSKFNTTIDNPNYVGGIAAVLTIIFLTIAVFENRQEIKNRIVHGIMAVMSFAMLLTSFARSGFTALLLTFPIILVVIIKNRKTDLQWKKSITALVIIITLFSSVLVIMDHHNPLVRRNTIDFLMQNPFKSSHHTTPLPSVALGEFHIIKKITAYAETNESAASQEFRLPELPQRGRSAGSGRMYIWEKTVEMIKDRPLLGYGLDTYVYFFPQNDPYKYSGLGIFEIIVDKPHNMYLGLAAGSGIIALLFFLALLFVYFYQTMQFLWKENIHNESSIILLALFLGWIAYLIQGMFNDSIIGTAPIFWILFGVGEGLLHQEKERKKLEAEIEG